MENVNFMKMCPGPGQEVLRPWRPASPAAVCGGGRGGGGAAAEGPARPGRPSVAAGGGSSAAGPPGAALCGTTRTPAGPRGARPGTSAPSPDSPPGRHLTGRQTFTPVKDNCELFITYIIVIITSVFHSCKS